MRIAIIAAVLLTAACSHREAVGVADARQYAADRTFCEGNARDLKLGDVIEAAPFIVLTGGALGANGATLSYADMVEICLSARGYTLQ